MPTGQTNGRTDARPFITLSTRRGDRSDELSDLVTELNTLNTDDIVYIDGFG